MTVTRPLLGRWRPLKCLLSCRGSHRRPVWDDCSCEGRHVIRTRGPDFRGDFRLTAHRIDRHDTLPSKSISLNQLGDGRDLIRFRGSRHLAQGQAIFRRPVRRCATEIFPTPCGTYHAVSLPSMATWSPSGIPGSVVDPVPQTLAENSGFSRAKTRLNVSCEGMPAAIQNPPEKTAASYFCVPLNIRERLAAGQHRRKQASTTTSLR